MPGKKEFALITRSFDGKNGKFIVKNMRRNKENPIVIDLREHLTFYKKKCHYCDTSTYNRRTLTSLHGNARLDRRHWLYIHFIHIDLSYQVRRHPVYEHLIAWCVILRVHLFTSTDFWRTISKSKQIQNFPHAKWNFMSVSFFYDSYDAAIGVGLFSWKGANINVKISYVLL